MKLYGLYEEFSEEEIDHILRIAKYKSKEENSEIWYLWVLFADSYYKCGNINQIGVSTPKLFEELDHMIGFLSRTGFGFDWVGEKAQDLREKVRKIGVKEIDDEETDTSDLRGG